MNLYITSGPVEPLSGMKIEPPNLRSQLSHLVIASQKWDALYIDIDDAVPDGYLKRVVEQCGKVYPFVDEHPSMHQVHLLCDCFPELGGSIRKCYMTHESVWSVLPQRWVKDEHQSSKEVLS